MTAIIERQRARLYTQKAKKLRNVFYIQKVIHLTLRDFYETFEVGIYIQKAWHFALGDVYIYKKLDTSQKARQFAEGGETFYIKKTMHFAWHFYIEKTMHFALRCFIQKAWHYALHFNIQKIIHFSLRLYFYNLYTRPHIYL